MNNQSNAKYTEYFADWLAGGGVFPAAFENTYPLDNLKTNFTAYYIDREIGLETENLFNTKFELYANLYIAEYVKRANIIKQLFIDRYQVEGEKAHIKSGELIRTYAPTVTKEFDLPVNVQSAPATQEGDEYRNDTPTNATRTAGKSDKEEYHQITDVDSGYTPAELDAHIKELERQFKLIELECIKAFEPLFMQVF